MLDQDLFVDGLQIMVVNQILLTWKNLIVHTNCEIATKSD